MKIIGFPSLGSLSKYRSSLPNLRKSEGERKNTKNTKNKWIDEAITTIISTRDTRFMLRFNTPQRSAYVLVVEVTTKVRSLFQLPSSLK